MLDYHARYYSPGLGRFLSPDTQVPALAVPQNLNRYAYVGNAPLKYTDPNGHCWPVCTAIAGAVIGAVAGAVMAAGPQMIANVVNGQPLMQDINPNEVAKAAAAGAIVGAVGGVTFGAGVLAGVGVSTLIGKAVVGGAVGGAAYIGSSLVTGSEISAKDLVISVGVGAAFSPVGSVLQASKVAAPLLNAGRIGAGASAGLAQYSASVVAQGHDFVAEDAIVTTGLSALAGVGEVAIDSRLTRGLVAKSAKPPKPFTLAIGARPDMFDPPAPRYRLSPALVAEFRSTKLMQNFKSTVGSWLAWSVTGAPGIIWSRQRSQSNAD